MKHFLRHSNSMVFSISLIMLTASLYFEYVVDLAPCPLCIMQRLAVMLCLVLSGLSIFIHRYWWRSCSLVLQTLAATLGMTFAVRQVWLQHLPSDQVPACGPGLNYMLQYFPLEDLFHALFWGSGDCAEVHWRFLGLSMPEWSTLCFVVLLGFILIQFWTKKKA